MLLAIRCALTRWLDVFLEATSRFEQVAEGYVPFTPLHMLCGKMARDVRDVLDLGCGRGNPMRFINRHRRCFTVGADLFLPYLMESKSEGIHDGYVLCDVRRLPFRPKSFDTVLCLRLLEHLTLEEGARLLADVEALARRQVAIITPAYPFHQSAFEANPYQEHKRFWSASALTRRGYRVWPNGLRNVQFDTATMGRGQRVLALLGHLLWVLSGPIVQMFPGLAGDLVAVKDMDGATG